jgi:hypothetical protein
VLIFLGFVAVVLLASLGLTLLAAGRQRPGNRVAALVDGAGRRTRSAVGTLVLQEREADLSAGVPARSQLYVLFGLGLLATAACLVVGTLLVLA